MNRWRVLSPLGSGSYGAVYLVEDVDAPGQTYALKLALRPSDTRAEREVALLARTEHPNVVRVHDWGIWQSVAGSHLYFVMDWVQGLPLHTWAETTNPPLRELARVASTLVRTLDSTVVPPGTVHLRSPEALDYHRLRFREPGARYAFQPPMTCMPWACVSSAP